jgi:hypothetical protein
MSRNRSLTLLITILMSLFTASTVSAHRPATADAEGITSIPDATTSYAYYESLDSSGDVDIYTVSAEAGQFFHVGLNIPQIEGLETYGVSLALLGPGLPAVSSDALPNLPHEHSRDAGVHSHDADATWLDRLGMDSLSGIVAPSEKSAEFYEPFTQTRYWGRQVLELDLPETGPYYLLVWHPQGIGGKYVMDTGRAEVFGPSDLFRFPVWWVQTHIYFEHTAGLLAAAAGLVLIITGAMTASRWLRLPRLLRQQESMA